jgi:alkylation response protein AidB-like acyl-CoA dehydrogenase
MQTLVSGRLSVASGCLGSIEDCLAECLTYARSRKQHGREIGKHQLVQDHIAKIEILRASAEAMIERAATAKQASDEDFTSDAARQDADFKVAQAKYYASNAAWQAADHAVQVFGGRGWSELYRPMRHLQDVRVCRIYEGTDEIMKLKIAAKLLGREYEAYR